jgi:5'-nucleotidase
MRLLLSNDDGVLAPGLAALYAAVADMGEVAVVAPDSPQSAAGHSITIGGALAVRPVRIEGPPALRAFSVSGRPADCVRLAVRSLLPDRPDLVLSGINAGANVGINVFYSGTVAAAAEGAMFGIPSVAFSLATGAQVDFAAAAVHCRAVLAALLASGLRPGDLINVNIPPQDGSKEPAGVRVVKQSTSGISDEYVRMAAGEAAGAEATDAELQSFRLGSNYDFLTRQEDTDVVALAEGFITVTPLHVDMTDHARLTRLAQLPWR